MAKQYTPTTRPKADIDFENELRGAVAENQYKNYVLSLLFIDARKLGQMASRRLCLFQDEDIA